MLEFHYAGVFATSPVSNVINGSTWSISYEFWCYIGVILLGVSGALRSKAILSALFAFTIALAVAFSIYHWTPGGKFLHGWNRFGDFSYGTYLYAYPVQQLTMRWFGHAVPPLELFAIAAPATILCAVASYHLVEKHFLRVAHAPAGKALEEKVPASIAT